MFLFLLRKSKYLKMGKIKLTYFNLRARAEIARLILAHAGEDYEDKRVEFSDWHALKPSKLIKLFCLILHKFV